MISCLPGNMMPGKKKTQKLRNDGNETRSSETTGNCDFNRRLAQTKKNKKEIKVVIWRWQTQ